MSGIQQDFGLPDLKSSSYYGYRGPSSPSSTIPNYVFNEGNDDIIWVQEQSLQNTVISTDSVDEHEDPSSSLKRKFKGTTLNSDSDKFIKNVKTDVSVKENNRKNRRQSSRTETVPIENAGPEEVHYALYSEQRGFEKEKKDLVFCKNQNIFPEVDVDEKDIDAELNLSKHQKVVKSFIERGQETQLNELDRQYLEHFKHAYTCPKLQDQECCLSNCKDPRVLIAFINEKLKMEYNPACINEGNENGNAATYRNQMNVNMVYRVIIHHVAECDDRSNCSMPLCKQFDCVMSKFIEESSSDGCYEVVLSNNNDQNGMFYMKGIDFRVNFDYALAKGAFGKVSHSWFVDHKKREASVAIKKIDLLEKKEIGPILGCSIPMLEKVKLSPNVLTPDLVLRSDKEALMVMEKGEMSLFDYMKCFGGLSPQAVTSYLFQMAKGVNQLHEHDLTHGDVKGVWVAALLSGYFGVPVVKKIYGPVCDWNNNKYLVADPVPNFILTNSSRNVKLIDLDTLKEEDHIQASGTPGYVATEVMTTRTVRKPADVYSLCQCIPVMLYGKENILKESRDKIMQMVMTKDQELASIYYAGTMESPEARVTAEVLVNWFRKSPILRKRWESYTAVAPPRTEVKDEDLCEYVFKSFFEATLARLPNTLELD